MSLINILERNDFMSGDMPPEDHRGVYLPGPVAVEAGVLADPDEKVRSAGNPDNPPGVDLANSMLPNGEIAGLVDMGNDVVAFDLVAVESIGLNRVRVRSIAKSNVTKEGKIIGEGVVAAQSLRRGWLRFVAVAVNTRANPWLPGKLTRGRTNPSRLSKDGITVFNAPAMEVADHEVSDLSLQDNSYDAALMRRFW